MLSLLQTADKSLCFFKFDSRLSTTWLEENGQRNINKKMPKLLYLLNLVRCTQELNEWQPNDVRHRTDFTHTQRSRNMHHKHSKWIRLVLLWYGVLMVSPKPSITFNRCAKCKKYPICLKTDIEASSCMKTNFTVKKITASWSVPLIVESTLRTSVFPCI